MARKTHATWCILFLLSIASLSSACDTCKFPPKGFPANPFCPRDTLKLGVCADLLGGSVATVIGTPPRSKCCTVLDGLVDLEAAACLCTAIKANVLGVVNLNVPVALSLLVSACGKKIPDGFKCI
ncbi:14 kDa proline-rich protein DC2.15-like [Magnolia sinica]|uniref:14 kDa proline-rich protein DC2.15-like n=1 Tax=Magnolia sinica TaxID=86752 RepID=UPI00265B0A29|nr:14 kDa proline-rich protein DC2.15-like [Magnolia sinica]